MQIPGGADTLHAVFSLAQNADTSRAELLAQIAVRTRWNRNDLAFLDGVSGLDLAFPAAYRDERALARFKICFALLTRLGVSAEQARDWTGEELTEAQGRHAKQAAAAKYEEDRWLVLAKPLRDVLRDKQRQALVDYLVHHPDRAMGQTWEDTDGLYAHFLIDVEMSPCMTTSRIKQAIASCQLFAQRCLMNLESEVAANTQVDREWVHWNSWMKNYRVWEANRKVFLWPENWIEPELRDDKSPFFAELENELLQTEVTSDSAEAAFMGYLQKLDQVARLEIVGFYHEFEEDDAGQAVVDTLHVIGRTYVTPHAYFYRRREKGHWTAWEKVDLDIEGDRVIPVVWNRRLYVFWPMFLLKTEEKPLKMPEANQDLGEPEEVLGDPSGLERIRRSVDPKEHLGNLPQDRLGQCRARVQTRRDLRFQGRH